MHDSFALAERVVKSLSAQRKTIVFAESCTGGMIADLIVRIPGASNVLWGSFVCYTEGAKTKMLGIPEILIEENGVVSKQTALAMAEGALRKSGASLAFSVTGFAGPQIDSQELPVGTVWIAVSETASEPNNRPLSEAKMFLFKGNRNEVREAAAIAVLELLLKKIK